MKHIGFQSEVPDIWRFLRNIIWGRYREQDFYLMYFAYRRLWQLFVYLYTTKDVLKMIVESVWSGELISLISSVCEIKPAGQMKPYLRLVNSSYRKLVVLIIVSTIPTGIIRWSEKDVIGDGMRYYLFRGFVWPDSYRCPAFYCRSCKRWNKLPKVLHIQMHLASVLHRE